MTDQIHAWTYEQFLAYLLVGAASADFIITKDERNFITEKVGESTYLEMKDILNQGTESQRQEILNGFKTRFIQSQEAKEKLTKDLRRLFLSDGDFHDREHKFLDQIHHILWK